MSMKRIVLSGLFIGLLTSLALLAQSRASSAAVQTETRTPAPSQLVTIPMADGLEVKGDFYPAPEGEPAPAMLLLHQLNASGASWRPFALPLNERGYNVLAVDMRGQGITGG
jgi:predicted alpha/beta hydrolase